MQILTFEADEGISFIEGFTNELYVKINNNNLVYFQIDKVNIKFNKKEYIVMLDKENISISLKANSMSFVYCIKNQNFLIISFLTALYDTIQNIKLDGLHELKVFIKNISFEVDYITNLIQYDLDKKLSLLNKNLLAIMNYVNLDIVVNLAQVLKEFDNIEDTGLSEFEKIGELLKKSICEFKSIIDNIVSCSTELIKDLETLNKSNYSFSSFSYNEFSYCYDNNTLIISNSNTQEIWKLQYNNNILIESSNLNILINLTNKQIIFQLGFDSEIEINYDKELNLTLMNKNKEKINLIENTVYYLNSREYYYLFDLINKILFKTKIDKKGEFIDFSLFSNNNSITSNKYKISNSIISSLEGEFVISKQQEEIQLLDKILTVIYKNNDVYKGSLLHEHNNNKYSLLNGVYTNSKGSESNVKNKEFEYYY